MENITIRKTILADKEDILKIHDNVYDGGDYLAYLIDEFFDNPNSTSYVAVSGGKLIGYTNMFLVDDGRTVISRASRVSPNAQGQGVYKTLHMFALNETSATSLAFTTTLFNKSIYKPSFQQEYSLLTSMRIQDFKSHESSVEFSTERQVCTIPGLHVPSDDELDQYFGSSVLKSYLFPSNRIMVNWCPFQLIRSNIGPIRNYVKANNLICSNVTVDDDDNEVHGLLSISTTIRTKDPPFSCHVFIYGSDTKTLANHVDAHVSNAKNISKGARISFLSICQLNVAKDEVIKCFTDAGLSMGSLSSRCCLFEKELQ